MSLLHPSLSLRAHYYPITLGQTLLMTALNSLSLSFFSFRDPSVFILLFRAKALSSDWILRSPAEDHRFNESECNRHRQRSSSSRHIKVIMTRERRVWNLADLPSRKLSSRPTTGRSESRPASSSSRQDSRHSFFYSRGNRACG